MRRLNLISALFGIAFGLLFSAAGFNQYDVIHSMLLLKNHEPFLVMGSSMAVALPALWYLERRRWRTLSGTIALRRWPIERNKLWGGVVFGTGWAITGACPGTAATMVGGGSLLGLVLGAGILTGIAARDATANRLSATPSPHRSGGDGVRSVTAPRS